MTATPRILLIDDGELEHVAAMLERLGIEHTRLRGGLVEPEVAPPSDLLIATPRRAAAVRRGSPVGASTGRPLRIIAVGEDSNAMRRMLRRMGFHLLVRRGAHPDVWRLLVERALFEGDERRVDPRLPVVAPISFTSSGDSPQKVAGGAERAMLIDISNRGCRIRTPDPLDAGASLSLEIPLPDGATLRLKGHLVRAVGEEQAEDSKEAGDRYSSAILFDRDLPGEERTRLAHWLNDLSVGPGASDVATTDLLPACESPVIPGLTLDQETDPALPVGVEIEVQRDREGAVADASSNRRQTARASFAGAVMAVPEESSERQIESHRRVLMGRDLSAGGMRTEPTPGIRRGDRFQLAIYGPAQPHPFLVQAIVEREDEDGGIALRFTDVAPDLARGLEKLVACLPDIESLEDGETAGMGAVISEILSRSGSGSD